MAKAKGRLEHIVDPARSFEDQLAVFWRERAGIKYSQFDKLCNRLPPKGMLVRPAASNYNSNQDWQHLQADLTFLFDKGYPLSFEEYHVAIAGGRLGHRDTAYVEYFKTHWHETSTHSGYWDQKDCPRCQEAVPVDESELPKGPLL